MSLLPFPSITVSGGSDTTQIASPGPPVSSSITHFSSAQFFGSLITNVPTPTQTSSSFPIFRSLINNTRTSLPTRSSTTESPIGSPLPIFPVAAILVLIFLVFIVVVTSLLFIRKILKVL